MTQNQQISAIEQYVREELRGAEAGHDWWHIVRVRNNAMAIAASENVDLFVVEAGALLHDIADHKFTGGDESVGPEKARQLLESLDAAPSDSDHIISIIRNISFKGGNFTPDFSSPELDVVRDADRLDAIGAIGIARAFSYGGFKGRAMYNPEVKPDLLMTVEQYKASSSPTINHFYEKLLLLKDRMSTVSGRRMAEERHRYMEGFLEEFFREWGR